MSVTHPADRGSLFNMHGCRLFLSVVALACLLPMGGCTDHTLETGYAYTPLGSSSSTQRRAYYAGPFSPEARAAMMSDQTSTERRRPGM